LSELFKSKEIPTNNNLKFQKIPLGISGIFFGDYMTDKVQAKRDLEFCSAELSKYQNLSRTGLTRNEMLAIDGIMIKLKYRIKNLREALYA